MITKDKELLLKDLCDRLPYKVKVSILGGGAMELQACIYSSTIGWYFDIKDAPTDFALDEIKPYLHPMSSMTEEEKKEYHNLCYEEEREEIELGEWITKVYYHNTVESIDWLNSHHFDYRGLIEKGLALEAPKGMYKTNK